MNKTIDVSIIIISYNTCDLTITAIESVYRETESNFEIIVVDNNSTDESVMKIESMFPGVKLICLNHNAGFALGNNIGAEKANGKYILLLNPDTEILDHAVDRLVRFAELNPQYGLYGGATFFSDMSRNPTAGYIKPSVWSLFASAIGLSSLFRRSKFFSPESLAWWDWSHPKQIDIITGCFLLIRSSLWKKLGGFDTRFHMYAEDADLSFRVRNEGLKCVLNPHAAIIHHGGASETVRSEKMQRLFRAKCQLFRKHMKKPLAEYAVWSLKLYSLIRFYMFGAWAIFSKSKNEAKDSWKRVWRNRAAWCRQQNSVAVRGVD